MNWWLIALAAIVAVLTIAVVFCLVVLFEVEEEKSETWLPKIVVVLSLSFACYNVLLLPYDVANVRNSSYNPGGDVDVTLMWMIILIVLFFLTFLVCPFAMVYYEFRDPEHRTMWQQIRLSVIVTSIIVVIFLVLFFLSWGAFGYASIAYAEYQVLGDPSNSFSTITEFSVTSRNATLQFRVSFFVYFVAFTCMIGWLLFFIFGGVGLAAIPIDYIMYFRNRPRSITAAEYAISRAEIAQESQRLMESGKGLEEEEQAGQSGRRHREKVLKFKQQVRELELSHCKLETSYREKGGPVIKGYLYLFLGIVFASMSFVWVLHVIIHNMAHAHPFLNNMFCQLDKAFMLFGVLAYGCFSFYLLWCVVKGCIKIGGNLILFQIYPLEFGGTFMNAFIFNAMLIMLSSIIIVQFCTVSFSEYAANTNIGAMFTVYVANIQGIKYVVMYLQYPLLVIACLSIIWLLICPKRRVDDD